MTRPYKLKTGRFNTRAELIDRVWSFLMNTNCSYERIAKNVGMSAGFVSSVYTWKRASLQGNYKGQYDRWLGK